MRALRHEEPDRVPIDFGGTVDTTIQAIGYRKLRKRLGLRESTVTVADVYQQVAAVDDDVRERFDVDTMPLLYEPRRWRDGTLSDGTPARLPDSFRPCAQEDGSQVVFDAAGRALCRMPRDGFYFDVTYTPLAGAVDASDLSKHAGAIENFDKPAHLDKSYEDLAQAARKIRAETDRLIVGFYSGHLLQAALMLRGWESFLADMLVNQEFAHALLGRLLEANLKRFERYASIVGPYIDVVHFEEDLGMEDRTLIDPELYRRMVKPYQSELLKFAKSSCGAAILLHSDGAVASLIPDFIEMGIDALNPVQVSAAGMDSGDLKREFGRDISFWGAGCDSQRILPFGSPADVVDEVKRRIDDLAPGGGYVFAPVHNVQNDVPPGNVIAMYETAIEHGSY